MKNQTLIIGGVLAVGVVAYLWYMKSSSKTEDTANTKEKSATTDTSAPCGCKEGQTPCANKKCAGKGRSRGPKFMRNRGTSSESKSPLDNSMSPTGSASEMASIAPKTDAETETFAFTLNF